MVEFCDVDDRLLPTCYVPLSDVDTAGAMAAASEARIPVVFQLHGHPRPPGADAGDDDLRRRVRAHVEGGRRPIERFERSLAGADEATRRAFYHDNFVDLMGAGLAASV